MVTWHLPDVQCGFGILACMTLKQTKHLVYQHAVLCQGDLCIKEIMGSRAGPIACVGRPT